jgi:hypothetical protein
VTYESDNTARSGKSHCAVLPGSSIYPCSKKESRAGHQCETKETNHKGLGEGSHQDRESSKETEGTRDRSTTQQSEVMDAVDSPRELGIVLSKQPLQIRKNLLLMFRQRHRDFPLSLAAYR